MSIEHIPYRGTSDFTIGNCRATFACPRLWSKLTETADPLVRDCGSCNRHVYLCVTPDEVEAKVKAGNCIAVRLEPGCEPQFVGNMEAKYSGGEILTPSELESLRQHQRDANAYFQKAFKK